ncbi:hypothetical protein Amet_0695 [Alkaliphilus metalliredigens QYMF]|uniref:ComK family protein n=1 Tax=Alkaliphilus metalliredigens (strain QYMF) TaxID=293826 RepID=A6TL52_ALKMQ|nr:hypothetical protein [Alkaliphilus metalliredigens]ABR46920.1 hypothetical protein Amet_0695 [Alkaliphilus metalliredigens QYMF]
MASSIYHYLKNQHEIACLLPVYELHSGNCTKVIFSNQQELLLKQSIDTVLNSIARYYAIDLKSLRTQQQKRLNCTYYVPLPLAKNLLLFPVKTRIPRIRRDPAYGYVNYFQVKKIDNVKPVIHLNYHKIHCLSCRHTIMKRYHQAQLIDKLQESPQLHHNQSKVIHEEPAMYYSTTTNADYQKLAHRFDMIVEVLLYVLISISQKNE